MQSGTIDTNLQLRSTRQWSLGGLRWLCRCRVIASLVQTSVHELPLGHQWSGQESGARSPFVCFVCRPVQSTALEALSLLAQIAPLCALRNVKPESNPLGAASAARRKIARQRPCSHCSRTRVGLFSSNRLRSFTKCHSTGQRTSWARIETKQCQMPSHLNRALRALRTRYANVDSDLMIRRAI